MIRPARLFLYCQCSKPRASGDDPLIRIVIDVPGR